jgi:acyl carrier protein
VPEDVHQALVGQVRDVLLRTLAVDVPDASDDLIEGGMLDSLALVELLFELERQFEFRLVVGELDIESFRSVDRIAQFVAAKMNGKGP